MDGISMIVLAVSALVGFLVAGLLGKTIIPLLHKLHYGQTIREEGPSWHQAKQGTPTMGGLLFIIGTVAALVVGLVVGQLVSPHPPLDSTPLAKTKLFAGLIMALCCAAIGWADDYIKVVKKRNLGLTAGQKLFAQLLVATGYAVSVYMAGGSSFYLPFFGRVDWGIWFIPFCIFVIVAMTNATNLTDGLDGLCGSVSFLVTLLFLILAGSMGQYGQGILGAGFAGALVGFLIWNFYPARVFMGDTGSLFIGGLLCALAFGIGQPFLLIPAGIIYIVENLSVILQVTYFKLTHGKRLFKMSPLHHHFEMCGWNETKIVMVFSVVTLVGCLAALLLAYV